MHLSTSSVPLDPTLLTGFAASAPAGLPMAASADAGGTPSAEFGELFADLEPCAAATPPGLGGAMAAAGAGTAAPIFGSRFSSGELPRNSALPPGLARALSVLTSGATIAETGVLDATECDGETSAAIADGDAAVGCEDDEERPAEPGLLNSVASLESSATNAAAVTGSASPLVETTAAGIERGESDSVDRGAIESCGDSGRSDEQGRPPASGLPAVAIEGRATDQLPRGLARASGRDVASGTGRNAGLPSGARVQSDTQSQPKLDLSTKAPMGPAVPESALPPAVASHVAGLVERDGLANVSTDKPSPDTAVSAFLDAAFAADDSHVQPGEGAFDSTLNPAAETSDGNGMADTNKSSPGLSPASVLSSGRATDLDRDDADARAMTPPQSELHAATKPATSVPPAFSPAWAHANVHARFRREEPSSSVVQEDGDKPATGEAIGHADGTALPVSGASMRVASLPRGWDEKGAAAKFSVGSDPAAERSVDANRQPKKTFLSAGDERDAKLPLMGGTGIAKSATVMSLHVSNPESSSSALVDAAVGVMDSRASGATAATSELPTNASVNSAHEAVAVVLRAVEELTTRERSSVNLQFSVGDAELAVRVELHANEVRATFRTDSAELRAALNSEWQSASSSGGDRTVRIVPAIFSASENSAFNAFSGDASSRQRQGDRGEARQENAAAWLPRLGGVARSAANVAAAPIDLARSAAPNSRRLHTLA